VAEIEEILFGLTAVQFWVLGYLVSLSKEQGKNKIILPIPGEQKWAENKVSYKLLMRTLDELNDKRELLNIMVIKPEPQKTEVYIPTWLIKAISELFDSTKKFAT
jgi:hypothetical protein